MNITTQSRSVRTEKPVIYIYAPGSTRPVGTRAFAVSALMQHNIQAVFTEDYAEATHIVVHLEGHVARFRSSINDFELGKKIVCVSEGELQNPSSVVVHSPIRNGVEMFAQELLTLPQPVELALVA